MDSRWLYGGISIMASLSTLSQYQLDSRRKDEKSQPSLIPPFHHYYFICQNTTMMQALSFNELPLEIIRDEILYRLMNENASLHCIPLMLVNKQWLTLIEAFEIDWRVVLSCLAPKQQPYVLYNTIPTPQYTGLMRSICYATVVVPTIRTELMNYMKTHNIQYRSPKNNIEYTNTVNIKTLARLKVNGHPRYYRIIKSHRKINTMAIKQIKKLRDLYHEAGEWKKIPILVIKQSK